MRDTWGRIHAWLRTNAPEILDRLNPGASVTRIAMAERELGISFPDDYRQSLAIHDGQARAAWPLLFGWHLDSLDDVLGHWRALVASATRGDFPEGEQSSITTNGPVRPQWWNRQWIPITNDQAGNFEALDLDPAAGGTVGQVVLMAHNYPRRLVRASGVSAHLSAFASELDAGRARVIRGSGGELVDLLPLDAAGL